MKSKPLESRDYYKWRKIIYECLRRNRDVQQSMPTGYKIPPFDEFIEQERKENPGLIGEILVLQFIYNFASIKYNWDKSKLNFEIDLDKVYSVESLKKLVSEIIDSCYSASLKLKFVTSKQRPNMTDFDIILKVGDMKRAGKKNRDIAKAIHPRKYANNPESAIRLVAYYNKRYKELVDEKGFLNCGYP